MHFAKEETELVLGQKERTEKETKIFDPREAWHSRKLKIERRQTNGNVWLDEVIRKLFKW